MEYAPFWFTFKVFLGGITALALYVVAAMFTVYVVGLVLEHWYRKRD